MLVKYETEFEGCTVAYWRGGEGPNLLLLHGSGPGASTFGNWRSILEPLSQSFHIVAADLVGFGESSRKEIKPYFDLPLWSRQAEAMLGLFDTHQVGVLAHSLSGSIGLRLAATNARVHRLMTTGTMGAPFKLNDHIARIWTYPATREAIREAAASLVFDMDVITEAFVDTRSQILHRGDYKEYFGSMFGGDKQRFIDASVIEEALLKRIAGDVMLVHGRNDLVVPYEATTLPISKLIRNADVVALARCGHSPALEHPEKLVALARTFFS